MNSNSKIIHFMAGRRITLGISLCLIFASAVLLFTRGLSLGIDFTGGTLIEIAYPESVDLSEVRTTLGASGFEDAVVQYFGASNEILIRVLPREGMSSADISAEVLKAFNFMSPEQPQSAASLELRRVEFVGPQVGDELTQDGGLAVLYALIGILVYVTLRFEKRFALGSVIALIHDVLITLGILSLFGVEFSVSVLAAILAVIGYSLNDTIVIFDRIRENFRKIRKGSPTEIVDISLTQTLPRTLITSLTTLLVLLSLFFLGGEVIHGFAFTLIVGVLIGTYSSIYVASSGLLVLGLNKADLMPVVKEGAEMSEN